jgi:hypothetical protein
MKKKILRLAEAMGKIVSGSEEFYVVACWSKKGYMYYDGDGGFEMLCKAAVYAFQAALLERAKLDFIYAKPVFVQKIGMVNIPIEETCALQGCSYCHGVTHFLYAWKRTFERGRINFECPSCGQQLPSVEFRKQLLLFDFVLPNIGRRYGMYFIATPAYSSVTLGEESFRFLKNSGCGVIHLR